MAFDNSYTAVTGATYQAADYNTHVKGNFSAIWVGTTAGDMDYYSSATAKTRLAKGTALQVLRMNSGATAPEWATFGGLLHSVASVEYSNSPYFQTTSGSFVDITGASVDIVTTKTCKIVMVAYGAIAIQYAGHRAYLQGMIGGTATGDTAAPFISLGGQFGQFSLVHYIENVSAGVITCKLQGKTGTAGVEAYYERGRINVFAFTQ